MAITIAFLAGLVAGFYGATAGSGALVSFPVLLFLGLPTPFAIATNRLAATFLEVAAAMRFHANGIFDARFALLLGTLAAAGSILGSLLVIHLPVEVLNVAVSISLFGVLLLLFTQKKKGMNHGQLQKKEKCIVTVLTPFLGVYGGFFGVGFGTFMTMLPVHFGLSFMQSAAIARVVGGMMSFVSTLVFIRAGMVMYPEGIAMGIGSALGAWVGAHIGMKKGNAYVRALLVLIVVLSIMRLMMAIVV